MTTTRTFSHQGHLFAGLFHLMALLISGNTLLFTFASYCRVYFSTWSLPYMTIMSFKYGSLKWTILTRTITAPSSLNYNEHVKRPFAKVAWIQNIITGDHELKKWRVLLQEGHVYAQWEVIYCGEYQLGLRLGALHDFTRGTKSILCLFTQDWLLLKSIKTWSEG